MDTVQSEYGFAKINLSKWKNAKVQISIVSLDSYMNKVFNKKASDALKLAEELLHKIKIPAYFKRKYAT